MKGVRDTGFIVSLALLASVAGHFAIARWTVNHPSPARPAAPLEFVDFDESDGSFSRSIVPVSATSEARVQRIQQIGNPPVAVPVPVDAAPVEKDAGESQLLTTDQAAVRGVIEQELSHATAEEREIWFDELKSLPAAVVRDLLQVRKQIRALPRLLGGVPEKLASADAASLNRTHEIAAEPASQKIRFSSPEQVSAVTALEEVISQLRHNSINAATPGYKRLRVTLIDCYSSTWAEEVSPRDFDPEKTIPRHFRGEGCRIAPVLVDMKQGEIRKTSRQLDVAIDGEGFLIVQRGDEKLLTRCGILTFDRQRRLCLGIAEDAVPLQPVVQIPLEMTEIQIAGNGSITGTKSGETMPIPLGNLELGYVPNSARLTPVGCALFVPNAESGELVTGTAQANGLGSIQQGCLEQSNVSFAYEQEQIDELAVILKSLPMPTFRPATAGKSEQPSNH